MYQLTDDDFVLPNALQEVFWETGLTKALVVYTRIFM